MTTNDSPSFLENYDEDRIKGRGNGEASTRSIVLSKFKDVETKSIEYSKFYKCQAGIMAPSFLFEHALYLILHLSGQHESKVKEACKKLPELKISISQLDEKCKLEATLGIGYSKAADWLANAEIPFPKGFIEFKEKKGPTGKSIPYTKGDILLHIRSNRKDLCFELGYRFCQSIPRESITEIDDTFGFAYMSSRESGLSLDFTGFEDGNENPEDEEQRAKAALIDENQDDEIHIGGSFALTQKWKHNLNQWNELLQVEQEKVIGRTKGERSVKLRPKNAESHTTRVDLEENGIDIKVVRQSLSYGDMKDHGLFFISYASDVRTQDKQLNNMVGMGDGVQDRIMDFSTPVTGNYWFIPSINVFDKLFSTL